MSKTSSTRRQSAKPTRSKRPPADAQKPAARGGESPAPRKKARKAKPQKLIQLTLDQKLDILGVGLVFAGLVIALTLLPGPEGALTGTLLKLLRAAVGWDVYPVPLGLFAVGVWLLVRHFGDNAPRIPPERAVGLFLAWLAALPTLHMIAAQFYQLAPGDSNLPLRLADQGLGGGYFGYLMQGMLVGALDTSGAVVALAAWWMIALALTLGTSVVTILVSPLRALARLRSAGRATVAGAPASAAGAPPPRIIGEPSSFTPDKPATPVKGAPAQAAGHLERPASLPRPGGSSAQAPAPAGMPQAALTPPGWSGPGGEAIIIGSEQPWELPALPDILEEGAAVTTNDQFDLQRSEIIQHTLASFGLPVNVTGWNRGPAITQFEVKPGFIEGRGGKTTKVKVSRIAGLADDLALALAAASIRIEAPIPGRDVVGVEVPNEKTEIVALRDIMESENFQGIRSLLAIGLGADVSGQAMAADLARMPHLLIAGTTGSGKSVCVNAIITCLLSRNTPDQLKFIMVDPKRVELTNYNGIPHLIAPVVVDLERVVGVLQWVTREMDERYRKFAKIGGRNIEDYNTKAIAKGEARLPYIVVVIDELADLMMLAPEDTERTICRLAQMARATGIHLIIATQRPSVDVITGLIKANFPARIAFAVASSVDSRVILDGPGAERLLGRGDMLFMSPEAGQPLRLQGCWVSDREIGRLVRYWKNARGLEETPALPAAPGAPVPGPVGPIVQAPLWEELGALEAKAKEEQSEDELLEESINIVRAAGKASISLLQRRLRIGYTRAARLIDLLEEKGIVGPAKEGSTPREVFPPRGPAFVPGNPPPVAAPAGGPGASGEYEEDEGDEEDDGDTPTPPPAPAPRAPGLRASERGPRPMGQNPPKSKPVDIPPWRD